MAINSTVIALPPSVSTAEWIQTVNLDDVKDSMMLTAMTFLMFGNAMAGNVKAQANVVTAYSDLMLEANSLMADINTALGPTSVTDTQEGQVKPFATLADAQAYCKRFIAAGGTPAISSADQPNQVATGLNINHPNGDPAKGWQVYAYRTPMQKINDNLQLSINNWNNLQQQANLVLNQANTRMGSAMDYVTSSTEKFGKLLQSFTDNMRR